LRYDVIFDFATEPFGAWSWLVLRILSIAWGVYLLLRPGSKLGKVLIFAFLVGLSTYSIHEFTRDLTQYNRLKRNLAYARLTEVEGYVFLPPDGSTRFFIGSEAFAMDNGLAFSAGPEWLEERLVGRCVRAKYNTRREILWLGVRERGCARPPTNP
jgi:hypothetical protein